MAEKQSGISYHVIADELYTEQNIAWVVNDVLAPLNPRWVNIKGGERFDRAVMMARLCKRQLPNTRVILRHWPDDGQHKTKPYKTWYAEHKAYLDEGFTMLYDNESWDANDMRPYSDIHAGLMHVAGTNGHSIAYGRFSTGTPGDGSHGANQYPQLDSMFREAAVWDALHVWSPNEYFDLTPQDSGGNVARYLLGWAYCDNAKDPIQRPLTNIGEFALAVNHGAYDGYLSGKARGMSENQFADMFLQYYMPWYWEHGVDVLTFSLGRWRTFGVGQTFIDRMLKFARQYPAQEQLRPKPGKPTEPPAEPPPTIPTPPVLDEAARQEIISALTDADDRLSLAANEISLSKATIKSALQRLQPKP